MKKVGIGIGAVVGLFVLLGLGQLLASESGEVLVLETLDAEGQPHETRIWVVDDAGAFWVRGGLGLGLGRAAPREPRRSARSVPASRWPTGQYRTGIRRRGIG